MSAEISGVFIAYTPDELDLIDSALLKLGYDAGGGGLKKYLMDSLAEEKAPERVMSNLSKFVEGNPQMVGAVTDAGKRLVGNVFSQVLKGK